MLATLESFFHRLRRRFSRSEWAVRRFGLPVSEDTSERPGLLLIHIGGLSRHHLETADTWRAMPYLERLKTRERYRIHVLETGADTPDTVQAELFYGSDVAAQNPPVEKIGLLRGGSSWSGLHRGGADREECHFCASCPGSGLGRRLKFGGSLVFLILEFPAVVRVFSRFMGELLTRFDDPRPALGRRELLTAGAKIDLVRGLPVVFVHFSDLRDVARRRARPWVPAGRSLRGIDNAVRALVVEAHRSQRRDYQVWIFSEGAGRAAERTDGTPEGFVLAPPATGLPAEGEAALRPADLRLAAMSLLERPAQGPTVPSPPAGRLTVMSYNVHGCIGMDGRVSPRRIARVIARQHADIVALQELDHGRPRSRAEDQAGDIAAELGFHLLFCPTVVHGDERYGHALLSRWPLETVKIASLPAHPGGVWPEPRAAIWARVHAPEAVLNVLSTHLGLAAPERLKQMTALLGPEWLGPVLDGEPVILCGDFNLTPGSEAHRLAATRLRDVAHGFKKGVHTFSSLRLVAQLDHIFVSPSFGLESVFAAQNDLTRRASDHLPLVAHLRLPGK